MVQKLDVANDNEIFDITGCLSNCHKYKYFSKPTTSIYSDPTPNRTSALTLRFYYPATEHEVREQVREHVRNTSYTKENKLITFQYIIYDMDALIADVGGFLGLLIGQSAYGLFEALINWLKGSKMIK